MAMTSDGEIWPHIYVTKKDRPLRGAHDLAKDRALVEVRRRESLPECPLAGVEPEQLEQRVLPVGGGPETRTVGVELGPEVAGGQVQSWGRSGVEALGGQIQSGDSIEVFGTEFGANLMLLRWAKLVISR